MMKAPLFTLIAILGITNAFSQTFKWAQKVGSTSSDFARYIATDHIGNNFVIGGFNGNMVFPGTGTLASRTLINAGQRDIYFAKFDCNRNLIWKNSIGGTGNECGDYVYLSVKYDNKNHLYVTGAFQGNATFSTTSGTAVTLSSFGSNDIFLAKYDTSGVLLWAIKSGGTATDEGLDVELDNLGNVFSVGFFSGTSSFATTSGAAISRTSAGVQDIFVAKYTPNGVLQWVARAGSPSTDLASSVTIDKDDNIYVGGNYGLNGGTAFYGIHSLTNSASWGGFLAKLSKNGVWLWANGMGGTQSEVIGRCVVDANANVYASGHFQNSSTTFSSQPPNPAISLSNNGNFDMCVVSFDSSGKSRWGRSIGSNGVDYNWHVNINDTRLIVSGYFNNTVNFGSGLNLTSNGLGDGFICQLNKDNGVTLNALQMGGNGDDYCYATVPDKLGNLYTCGSFNNTATFGSFSLSSTGSDESFFAKLAPPKPIAIRIIEKDTICAGDSSILIPVDSIVGLKFQWFLNNNAIVGDTNIFCVAKESGLYKLKVTNLCNEVDSSQEVRITKVSVSVKTINDTTICRGQSIRLNTTGATNYQWLLPVSMNSINIPNPMVSPTDTTTYIVLGTIGACSNKDTVKINVNSILANAGLDREICKGDSVQIISVVDGFFTWSPTVKISDSTSLSPYVSPDSTQKYILKVTKGACINYDTVSIKVLVKEMVNAGLDSTICSGDSVQLSASGGNSYQWNSSPFLSSLVVNKPYAKPTTNSNFIVKVTTGGCSFYDTVFIMVKSLPFIDAGLDTSLCKKDTIQLVASGIGIFQWSPNINLSNGNILNPKIWPEISRYYILTVSDGKCLNRDSIFITVNLPLPMSIGVDKSICPGDTLVIEALGSDSVLWTPGLMVFDSLAKKTYTAPLQTISLIAFARQATCPNSDTLIVNVTNTSQIDAGMDKVLCEGGSVMLNANGGGDYQWNPSPYLSSLVIKNPIANPIITSDFVVKVGALGCYGYDTVRISVNPLPPIDAGVNKIICKNDTVQLLANGNNGFNWSPNNYISNQFVNNPKVWPLSSQYYYVSTFDGKCFNTDSIFITVNEITSINAGLDQSICVGDTAQLEATGFDKVNWTPSLLVNDSMSNITYTVPSQTIEFVVFTRETNCPNSDTVIITVNDLPIVDAGKDSMICLNQGYQLNGSVTGGDQYLWSPENLLSAPTQLNPNLVTLQNALFVLSAKNAITGCRTTDTLLIKIDEVKAKFEASTLKGMAPLSIVFKNLSTDANTYLWNFSELSTSQEINPTYVFTTFGKYAILLTAISSNGCQDTTSIEIEVEDDLKIFIPNVFTPNGDSINDFFVNEINNYPVLLRLHGSIWNRWGEKVHEYTMPNGQWWDGRYNGIDCSSGVYFYIVEAETKFGKKYDFKGTVTLLR